MRGKTLLKSVFDAFIIKLKELKFQSRDFVVTSVTYSTVVKIISNWSPQETGKEQKGE